MADLAELEKKADELKTCLNHQQARFAEEFLIDLNGKQAAIRAGYTPKSAEVTASRLLSHVKVKAYVDILKEIRSERTNVRADEVVAYWAKVLRADIRDYVEFGMKEGIVDITEDEEGNKVIVKTVYPEVRVKPDSAVDGTLISEIKVTTTGLAIKLNDKMKASENLAEHLGLKKKELDVNVKGPIKVRFAAPNEE